MDKQETLAVINQIIDESTKFMKQDAQKLLEAKDWDYDTFGDRNTFARLVIECLFDREKEQYITTYKSDKVRRIKQEIQGSLPFI